jgi:hypothetical protein
VLVISSFLLFCSAFFLTLIAAARGLMAATWFDHGGWERTHDSVVCDGSGLIAAEKIDRCMTAAAVRR